jgi:hypothetical protein
MRSHGEPTWAQVTRDEARRLDLKPGDVVHLRAVADIRLVPSGAPDRALTAP